MFRPLAIFLNISNRDLNFKTVLIIFIASELDIPKSGMVHFRGFLSFLLAWLGFLSAHLLCFLGFVNYYNRMSNDYFQFLFYVGDFCVGMGQGMGSIGSGVFFGFRVGFWGCDINIFVSAINYYILIFSQMS